MFFGDPYTKPAFFALGYTYISAAFSRGYGYIAQSF
jgi:hypothetical protein